MKRLTAVTTITLSVLLLTSCEFFGELYGSEEPEQQPVVPVDSEIEQLISFETTSTTQPTGYSDIDSQLMLIYGNYSYLCDNYDNYVEIYQGVFCAVTDLNHNGRLEVIISSCMGSGAFSCTRFYEVSEDYSSLEELKYAADETPDQTGDFAPFGNDSNPIMVFDCYKKDDRYYYLVEDYASAGWTDKYIGFYSYSFEDSVNKEFIGSTAVSVNDEDKIIKTWLYDSSGTVLKDYETYEANMNEFWSGYEKQNSCEVKWFYFSDECNFRENLKDSWRAFNPDSDKDSGITYDFHSFFYTFYGDNYEYVIQES